MKQMMVLVLIALSLLTPIRVDATTPWNPDTLTEKQTISVANKALGEVGPLGVFDFTMMVCTIKNRLISPHYPSTPELVLMSYFAKPRTANAAQLQLTKDLLTGQAACPVEGLFYAMSGGDVASHGWKNGDVLGRRIGRLQIHYFYTWPARG